MDRKDLHLISEIRRTCFALRSKRADLGQRMQFQSSGTMDRLGIHGFENRWCTIRTCKREYVNMKSCAENTFVPRTRRRKLMAVHEGVRARFDSPEDLPFVLRPGLDVNFATSTIFTANVCPVWRWMHFLTTLNGPLKQR